MVSPFLSIRNVKKSFCNVAVLKDFNLNVGAGEFVSFIGSSGCGKTTMRRIVADFEEHLAGKVLIGS